MNVIYKCDCTTNERTVSVPDRVSGTDLGEWMNLVTVCVSYDHRNRSPKCSLQKVDYLKIPHANEGAEVGVPQVTN